MAGTNNSWNNQIAGSYNQIILNAGTNGVAISTDASAATVNVATGSAVKTTTLGSTNSTSITTVACGTGGCNLGTSANAHATTVGSTTASATTIIQAPSGGVTLTGVQGVAVANKNYVTINTATGAIGSDAGPASGISTITGDTGGALSGTNITFAGGTTGLSFGGSGTTETLTFAGITANGGTVSLATDATASTINIGTGAGVKTSTFGSTNTTSSTIIKSGSGNVVINSGLTIDSTGRNYNTVQPAFFATLTATSNNVTGAGTDYVVAYDTEVFDQGGNFSSTTFTAPITGKYLFIFCFYMSGTTSAMISGFAQIRTSAGTFQLESFDPYLQGFTANNWFQRTYSVIVPLTSGQTATTAIRVFFGASDSIDLLGTNDTGGFATSFSGYLIC